ncbi:MAG: D-alanyl-D-alanine carboxypeptidase [Clostridia bacterium]|nr:D-alanyl-D-alanine carboxypeptidase [Clostridia bacterium]
MRKILASLLAVVLIFSIIDSRAEALELNGKSFILVECATGQVLYESNADERLAPASVTKIMTMLLIMEAIERGEITYDTRVTASARAKSMGGSTIFLDTGEEMTVDDLLKGIAVASGNDACVAMAEHLSGSVENFVAVMNNRAKELGMENTNFVTCNGLDSDEHYSSARDIAIMSRELIRHEDIFRYTTIWMDTLRDGKFQLANTNKLIRFYAGANGLKTGSTSKAKNCISATAKRDDMQLCAVVLASDTSQLRFNAASTLLNYGFENFMVKGTKKGEAAGEVLVKKGEAGKVGAVLKDDCMIVVNKVNKDNTQKSITLSESVEAPVKKGDKLGVMEIKTENGTTVVDIVAKEDVERVTFGRMYMRILKNWTH